MNFSFKALCILIFFWTQKFCTMNIGAVTKVLKTGPGLKPRSSVCSILILLHSLNLLKFPNSSQFLNQFGRFSRLNRWWLTFFCQFRLPSFLFRKFWNSATFYNLFAVFDIVYNLFYSLCKSICWHFGFHCRSKLILPLKPDESLFIIS